MTRKARFEAVIAYFSREMPEPETELQYRNPYELLVAVVLSAQCTDKRVNMVTPALFRQFPNPATLAEATFDDINLHIRSVSFANNKTRHLMGTAKLLMEQFGGKVPQTVEELILLPGVGRKTANVILSVVWEEAAMAVDTHVFRVAARIGLTKDAKNPLQAETQLIRYLPGPLVHLAHHWLILHGRYVCIARRPKCEQCGLQTACQYFAKEMRCVVEGLKKYDPETDLKHKLSGSKSAARRS